MRIKNSYYFSDDGSQIIGRTKAGDVFIIDSEDEYILKTATVSRSKNGYFQARWAGTNMMLHRIIIKTQSGYVTDHINTKKWDNRRANLRACTRTQNQANSRGKKQSQTGIKGVCITKRPKNPFDAKITVNGKSVFLGVFKTAEQAKAAYMEAAKMYYGEYARE